MAIQLEIGFALRIAQMATLPKTQQVPVLFPLRGSVFKLVLLDGLTTTQGLALFSLKVAKMVFLLTKLTISVLRHHSVQVSEIRCQETAFQHVIVIQMCIISETLQPKCVSLSALKILTTMGTIQPKNVRAPALKAIK